jgi:hypothetical protein
LLTVGLGCNPVDETVNSDSPPWTPKEGTWVGSTVGFERTSSGIDEIHLNRFGCVGNVTPAGQALCESLVTGNWTLPATSPDHSEDWNIVTPFGLELTGAFQDEERVFGSFTYEAANGCCQSEGTWNAVHETLAKETPPLVCHSPSGEEGLKLIPSGMGSHDESTEGIVDGDTLVATAGFQGGVMVLLDLELQKIELGGNLTITLQLTAEDGTIEAIASGDVSLLNTEGVSARWNTIWLIITDGESGDSLSLDELGDIGDKAFNLELTVSNNCGFLMKRQLSLSLTTTH